MYLVFKPRLHILPLFCLATLIHALINDTCNYVYKHHLTTLLAENIRYSYFQTPAGHGQVDKFILDTSQFGNRPLLM